MRTRLDPHEFLSSRFLHLLLLSVAYQFPLASQFNPCSSGARQIAPRSGTCSRCSVLNNTVRPLITEHNAQLSVRTDWSRSVGQKE